MHHKPFYCVLFIEYGILLLQDKFYEVQYEEAELF